MTIFKSRKTRISAYLGAFILSFGIIFFLLRGPYLSNSIKRIIIPVLENATRERIIIDKAVINLFPFYLQAKGFKLFDKDGNQLMWITKSRAYIDLLGLLSKEIRVRKLVLNEPDLTAGEQDVRRIIEILKKSDSIGEEGKYNVSLINIKLVDGNLDLTGSGKLSGISARGLFLDMVTRNAQQKIKVLMKSGIFTLSNNSVIDGQFDGSFKINDKIIEIVKLDVNASESTLSTRGNVLLSDDGRVRGGKLSVNSTIHASILNNVFALKRAKEGMLSVEGDVKLVPVKDSKWPGFDLDLKAEGKFYLETIMDIVGVEEIVTGYVTALGTVKGMFPDYTGKASGTVEDSYLDTLHIDDVAGDVTFKDMRFSLHDYTAHSYGGAIRGDGGITVPSGAYSTVADVSDVNSKDFFKFITWEPPFPEGKIDGHVQLSYDPEKNFEIAADIDYRNTSEAEGNLSDRLLTGHTAAEMWDNVILLKDGVLSSAGTDLYVDGIIDLTRETLDLNVKLDSRDAADLTAPYYDGFKAPLSFKGTMTGLSDDPEIKGKMSVDNGSVQGIKFDNASAILTYKIKSLYVEQLAINQGSSVYDVSGTIDFRKAAELFSFNDPYYRAEAALKDVDAGQFVAIVYKNFPGSAAASGTMTFEGDHDDYTWTGDLVSYDSTFYGEQLDKLDLKYVLHPGSVDIDLLRAHKEESLIRGKGVLTFDGKFDATLVSEKIQLCDFPYFSEYPIDAVFGLNLNGSGSVDNPELEFTVNIDESFFKGEHAGKGAINGMLKNRELRAEGSLFNNMVIADGAASFKDEILWNIDSRITRGRYDFLLSGFLKEVPGDFSISLEGEMKMKGRGRSITMSSDFNYAAASMYGYDFTNKGSLLLEMNNDKLHIREFSMAGESADLFAAGTVTLNKNYNIKLKGNMDIGPLRELSDKITALRGAGLFSVDITGPWKTPEIIGEVSLSEAYASLKEFTYKIGPVNGTVYLTKDRFTFDSIDSNFAGGTIVLSGAGYYDLIALKRFFMTADFEGIRIRPVEGMSAAIDGKLFYETSQKGSSLTGNIDIKRARYEKRVEWKSWLLGLNKINEDPVEYPAFLKNTVLNIRITGEDNIIIDNNIARTPVKVALNVTGKVAQRGLLGRIEANEGTIYFRSNEFNVLEGSSVDFVSPESITPVYHILADTYVANYYIKLSLDGTMDDFGLTLFSDPPLSESDILALLTVGQTTEGASGIEGGIAAGEATALITGGIQDTVEEQFKYYTGFERFEIEPHTTTEGAFVPKVTIGKRLFEDKLIVIYSSAIGTSEESVIKLEYKLDKNISVIGSRNEIGSAGVDLKYKFEFK